MANITGKTYKSRKNKRVIAKRNQRIFRNGLTYLMLCILLFLFAGFKSKAMPSEELLKQELFQDPIQEKTNAKPFSFEYFDKTYYVEPQAEYELYGLVLSHNNIKSLWDNFHDEKSVDIKDLCVAWDANLKNNTYKAISVKNRSFTCYVNFKDRKVARNFNEEQFSNNHLLSDDENVREVIRKTQVGDQIYLKGMLVKYTDSGFTRGTSLTRKDKGAGACETFFVEEARILKAANRKWHKIRSKTKYFGYFLAIFLACFFVWSSWAENR